MGLPVQDAALTAAVSSTIVNGKQLIGGARDKWRDSFETLDNDKWDFVSGMNPADKVLLAGDTQGSGFAEVCLDYRANSTISSIHGRTHFAPPYRLGFGISVSKRCQGEMIVVSAGGVDSFGNRVLANGESASVIGPSIPVKQLQVVGNVATISFDTPHGLKYDALVVISGAVDTRVNVQARVAQVRSRYAIQIPLTLADNIYSIGAACMLNHIRVTSGAKDMAGLVLIDTNDANGIYVSRGSGSPESLSSSQTLGTSYSMALAPATQPYAINLQPRFQTEFTGAMDTQRWSAQPIDALSASNNVFKRSQNIPSPDSEYAMFLDVVALPNRAVPIEIVSVVKTGTTTATVTTAEPHGLSTGGYIRAYGVRDRSLFPNFSADTIATVLSPTSFTCVWGPAATATAYGGIVITSNGAAATGAVNASVMGTSWYGGRLYVGTSTTTGILVGDVVRLLGVRDVKGDVRAGTGGRFRVLALNPNVQEDGIATGASTTVGSGVITMSNTGAVPFGAVLTGSGISATSIVNAITAGVSVGVSANAAGSTTGNNDITLVGIVLEPIDNIATPDTQPLINISAGAIYQETTARLHFTRCLDYTRTPVEITGGLWTGDNQQALQVISNSASTSTVTQGTAAAQGTEGAGAWLVRGGLTVTNDIPSGAITANATSGGVSLATNTGAMSFMLDATAVTGTLPRFILRVQGSFDAVNFYNIYDIGVLTNSTSKTFDSPVIPAEFRTIRYVRDIRGTTPSVTNSVSRIVRPLETARRQRRMIDRVLNLNSVANSTEWLYVGGCCKAQIVATAIPSQSATAPSISVQLCQGDPNVASNWYEIPGDPMLVTSAAASVATVPFEIGAARFARLSNSVASTGIAADTYELTLTAWE